MNSKKVNVIVNWKFFKCLKNMQTFLNFVNFYKRFIYEYFKLSSSLINFTKTLKQFFFFSWDSNDLEKKTFQELKHAFTIASILIHFDLDKKIWIETNASNYVMTNILSQKNLDDQLHLVAFMSKKMSSTKCNYEIYDKEFLIVIKVFEKWRSKCVNTSMKNFVKI